MRIEGWVLVVDIERLGTASNAIPVFLKIGEKDPTKIRRVILFVENVDAIENEGRRTALSWEND